jgi:homoserine O-acetyltransferase
LLRFRTDDELRVIPGIWGHFAGYGSNPADTEFIDFTIGELLAKPDGLD